MPSPSVRLPWLVQNCTHHRHYLGYLAKKELCGTNVTSNYPGHFTLAQCYKTICSVKLLCRMGFFLHRRVIFQNFIVEDEGKITLSKAQISNVM